MQMSPNGCCTSTVGGDSNNELTSDDGYFVAKFGVVGYADSYVMVVGDGTLQLHVGSDIFHAHEFDHAL